MRCANCDRPIATQADHDTIAEGDGEHLCWSRYGSPCESIDWRARALEARAERDAIATQRDAWERDCAAIAAALGYLPGECASAALGREVTEMRDALDIAQRERDEARAQLAALREAVERVVGSIRRLPTGYAEIVTYTVRCVASPTPHARPRDEPAVLAHPARGAVGDDEREIEVWPRGDDVG